MKTIKRMGYREYKERSKEKLKHGNIAVDLAACMAVEYEKSEHVLSA